MPLASQEVNFKICQDVDSKVLISLRNFLKQHDVQARGINSSNVHNYLTGFPHIPDISKNLVKSQFYLTACVGDVSNLYTNNHLIFKALC